MENDSPAPSSDRKLVQLLLRTGLGLSMLLMVVGLIVNISTGHIVSVPVGMFDLMNESMILGDRLLGIGVLVLALTPALRVLTLAALWTREKDWKFVGISIVVIIALIISVSLGGHA